MAQKAWQHPKPRSGLRCLIAASAVTFALAEGFSVAAADRAGLADLPVRGVVKARDYASLSTEQPMRVREVAFREGQAFRRGQTVVSFDCRRQKAELRSATAQVREAELNLSSSIALDRHNAIGRNDVEIARVRFERASAEKSILESRVADCEVVAPFDGRVVELSVRALEYTTPQRPYLVIIDDSALEIELIAPATTLASVVVGDPIAFAVDELAGRTIPARIRTIGAAVDPVSKTTRLLATVAAPVPGLVAGMSGTAVLQGESGRQ